MKNVVIIDEDELQLKLADWSCNLLMLVIEKIRAERLYEEDAVTLVQVAEHLRVSTQSILNWSRRNEHENPLPIHYVGADPRFYISEIKGWSRREAEIKLVKRRGSSNNSEQVLGIIS